MGKGTRSILLLLLACMALSVTQAARLEANPVQVVGSRQDADQRPSSLLRITLMPSSHACSLHPLQQAGLAGPG